MTIAFGAVIGEIHTSGTGSTRAFTTTATVPAGAKIVVSASWTNNVTLDSVDSSPALTWTVDKQQTGVTNTAQRCGIASADAPSGLASGSTITVHFSTTADSMTVAGYYATGLATGAPSVDATGGLGYTSQAASCSTNLVTTNPDDLLTQVVFCDLLTTDITPSGSLTNEAYDIVHADSLATEVAYEVVSSATTYTIGGSWTNSKPWVVCGVAYKKAALVEQEGFRFRNDDGSETTATWAATQDTNASVALAANIRLRALVDTTGDAASTAYTLRYKLSTDSVYAPVPVGAAPFPTIEGTSESSTNTAGTSHPVTLPAGIVDSDLVLILMDIGSTSATLDPLTDWGEILDESSANGLKILRYTGAGVPSDPTFTSSASTRSAQIAYRISGADKTITPQIGTTAAATDAAPNPPTVTPTGGVSKSYLFIAFYGAAGEEADDDTWSDTSPTNYLPSPPLQKACGTAGTNLGGMIAAASRQLATGSAEDPGTFAKDVSAAWRAQTVIVHPATPPVYVSPSGNVTAGGEATTAQLTAPSGKSTSDFTTGRMWDNENGADAIDIAADFYTEVEWCLQAQSPAVDTNIYQFRVYAGTAAFDTYTVTPELTIGSGDFGGTATPAVIALAATLPAVTTQAGAVKAPAVTALTATLPAAAGSGSRTIAPAVTALAATLPAVTPQAGYTKAATVTALTATIPAVTGSGGGNATPAATTLTVTIPAAAGSGAGNATPATIPLTVTIPPVSASGGGSATASPATTTLAVTIPAVTATGAGNAVPATTALTVTMPAVSATGTGLATPATIPLSVTIPAATASGGSQGTATPATTTLTVTMPAPTASGGVSSTATPAITVLSVTMPAATGSGSKTTSPAVIPLVVTLPAATGQGGSSGTATPNAIALVTVFPSPTLTFGYVVNPAIIQLAVAIGAAIASGLQPDQYPITVTLRDSGHTITVRVVNTSTTIRSSGRTATIRENR